jgi:protein involved in polysaccharide export with SLBB domain
VQFSSVDSDYRKPRIRLLQGCHVTRPRVSTDVKAWLKMLGVFAALLCLIPAWGQNISNYPRTRAIDSSRSRAEREAEQAVSLSADKIISLLRDEPGLLLRAKRLLVRKAYEQGRLLDPEELTDEALYQLVREDNTTRILITREIEERYYVRAKPTREEIERGLVPEREKSQTEKQAAEGQLQRAKNQEDAYWSDRETLPRQPQQYYPAQPAQPPVQTPAPEAPPVRDPRRQVERAESMPPSDQVFDSLPADASSLPRVRPDELPELLSASISDKTFPGGDRLPDRLAPNYPPSYPSSNQPSLGLPASGLDIPSNNQEPYPQGSRRDTPMRRPISPYWPTERRLEPQVLRHRPDPYADVPSLYDLYSQYSGRSTTLQRFGADIFRTGTGNFDELPMDLPVGPEYVLGPGDGLNIELWGSVSQRLQRVVDRTGRVALPEVGAVQVSGRSLGDVQNLLQSVLRTQFRDIQADVSLSRLRTVRVYVVGDVERPGAYDVSALSTPLNAVYIAGGPTSRGSLRIIRQYRGKQLVQEVDVYDLLLHGVRSGVEGLQPGDTILVPTLGPEVTVEGMVRRPAKYELNGEKDLAEVLELAGGVLQSGTLRHVDVERVEAHLSRTMLRLDIPENNNQESVTKALEDFQVQDGDKIKISPILPYADKTVYLDGHVFRPGKYAYRDGMKVTDLIKSYSELLPEPYKRHAEIIRLNPPDYQPVVLAFNLGDALAGKDQDLVLKPFDTVRVFGRFDFEDPPVVTVSGEVRDPGDHLTNGATYLRDAVYLAGGATPDALLTDAQVFRKTDDGKLKVIDVNLSKALAGDEKENILLEPKDRIFIHKDLAKLDPPTVTIQGEIARPGKYPLGEGMTAADLVRLAGGFKRGAYTETADLTRYEVENGSTVAGEHLTIPIARALAAEPDTDVRLHDGDVLAIRQLAGWNDVGATITVKGEVLHAGTYGIKEGERLSSIIARAGGFRGDAYPYGAIFERVQVREMEQHNRAELIRTLQDEGNSLKLKETNDPEEKLAQQAAVLQWRTTMERLQNTPPVGRLVIHISSNIKKWANTPADIEVRAGDVIVIPKRPNLVMVDGAVYNPTAVSYKPGKSAGWYLRQAGGPNNMANKKAIFVIRADGSVVGGKGGLFTGSAEDAVLMPGDTVVVPEKPFSGSSRWRNTLQAAQLAQAVAFSIQLARTF